MRWLLPWLLLPGFALVADTPKNASEALLAGNRLFRSGRLEEALATYSAGFDPAHPHPILAYNAGTTAHQLDELPLAILWYRRAQRAAGDDRWLAENLALARRELALAPSEPPGTLVRLSLHATAMTATGAVLAWAFLLLMAGWPAGSKATRRWSRTRIVAATVVGSLALVLFATGTLLPSLGPQPSVVLAPCGQGGNRLPAGSEVWARRQPGVGWTIRTAAGETTCPDNAVAAVAP